LFGRLANGGSVHVDIDDKDEVKLIFSDETLSNTDALATVD
jgi:ATP-dependent Clp protease ATP-binding subunit ClpA